MLSPAMSFYLGMRFLKVEAELVADRERAARDAERAKQVSDRERAARDAERAKQVSVDYLGQMRL